MISEISLKYGQNPYQTAKLFIRGSKLPFSILQGNSSYVNMLDALVSWQIARELRAVGLRPAVVLVKHACPIAVATALDKTGPQDKSVYTALANAYIKANRVDPLAAYGNWLASSEIVDRCTAQLIAQDLSIGIIAPGYTEEALSLLQKKQGGRYILISIDPDYTPSEAYEQREIFGIILQQERNTKQISRDILSIKQTQHVTIPADAENDLLLALITLKFAPSDAACIALDGQVIGIGTGQASRFACVQIATEKAEIWHLLRHPQISALRFQSTISSYEKEQALYSFLRMDNERVHQSQDWQNVFEVQPELLSQEKKQAWLQTLQGTSLASDGYIPFQDSIDCAVRAGVAYIAQPGNSPNDEEIIAACNKYGIVMASTYLRLFYH